MRTGGGYEKPPHIEVPRIHAEAIGNGLSGKRSELRWQKENEDRLENQAVMPGVLSVEETDGKSMTVIEFLLEQAENPFCKEAAETARKPGSRYGHD